MKYLITRSIDAALLACLVWGMYGFETFAFIFICLMIVVQFLGWFIADVAMAQKLLLDSWPKKLIRYAVWAGYVAGLVVTGHPGWAVAYLIGAVGLMAVLKNKLTSAPA
jgi:hypothetical protein